MSATPPNDAATSGTPGTEGLGSQVTSALGSADTVSSQRIQNLYLVQQARVAQQTRTAASVTARYGAGSPQAAAAEAAVTASKSTAARVAVTKQQLATPAPAVSAGEWVLHGRVLDADLQPLAGYTVYLADSQNNYQSAFGFAYTDSTGYFLLRSSGSPATTQSTASQLLVSVTDAKAQPVYLSATAFAPSLGNATYQQIALSAGAKPIGDPSEAIRRVAFPPER